MAVGWGGGDPVGVADAATYELGTEQKATTTIDITHLRVWSEGTPSALSNRRARLWSVDGGTLLATVTIPEQLPAGWSEHALTTPVRRTANQSWCTSFSVNGDYGILADAVTSNVNSAGGEVVTVASASAIGGPGNGRFVTTAGLFPNTSFSPGVFYGVDVVYDVVSEDETAPEISDINVSIDNLTVSATAVATDAETLTGAIYTFQWGDGAETSGELATASHSYAVPGVYALLAAVMDVSGLTDYRAEVVTVAAASAGFPPNGELVGLAWVRSLVGIEDSQVATTLPRDAATWRENGFVQLTIVGGSPATDTQLRGPVFSVDCWANSGSSSKPPWGKAVTLAERVVAQTYGDVARRILVMPASFTGARVLSVHCLSEPRRIEDDEASYAHYQFDLQIWWTEA